jgi:hypothetical protein
VKYIISIILIVCVPFILIQGNSEGKKYRNKQNKYIYQFENDTLNKTISLNFLSNKKVKFSIEVYNKKRNLSRKLEGIAGFEEVNSVADTLKDEEIWTENFCFRSIDKKNDFMINIYVEATRSVNFVCIDEAYFHGDNIELSKYCPFTTGVNLFKLIKIEKCVKK